MFMATWAFAQTSTFPTPSTDFTGLTLIIKFLFHDDGKRRRAQGAMLTDTSTMDVPVFFRVCRHSACSGNIELFARGGTRYASCLSQVFGLGYRFAFSGSTVRASS